MPAGSLAELRIPTSKAVADSWEEELDDDDDSTTPNADKPKGKLELPLAPPPTPATPAMPGSSTLFSYDNQDSQQPWLRGGLDAATGSGSSNNGPPSRRPEKSTAVAGRLIAGALGVKAPKKTEDQRAYEKAAREQELKRRDKERAEAQQRKIDEEKAKKAMWDD